MRLGTLVIQPLSRYNGILDESAFFDEAQLEKINEETAQYDQEEEERIKREAQEAYDAVIAEGLLPDETQEELKARAQEAYDEKYNELMGESDYIKEALEDSVNRDFLPTGGYIVIVHRAAHVLTDESSEPISDRDPDW